MAIIIIRAAIMAMAVGTMAGITMNLKCRSGRQCRSHR
jgi:hypothetical protein